jgi:hypothetical protein
VIKPNSVLTLQATGMEASGHHDVDTAEPAARSRRLLGSGVRRLKRHARRTITGFEGAVSACKLGAGLILLTAAGPATAAIVDITCTPTEVAVYPNRVHVACSATQTDGGATIRFWAVPVTDPQWANRFVTITSTALVSGRTLVLRYTPGDVSGQSFGCLSQDCRQVIMFSVR